MSNDVDLSGDYSYDLAHEVKSMRVPAPRKPSAFPTFVGVPFDQDPDAGDYGYDQAHE